MKGNTMAENILMYRDMPLVRHGNVIYYGYMDKPYIAVLQIVSTKEVQGKTIADRVAVQLFNTDPAITRMRDKVVKSGEKKGLYNALELGCIWLKRELKEG